MSDDDWTDRYCSLCGMACGKKCKYCPTPLGIVLFSIILLISLGTIVYIGSTIGKALGI